MTQEQLMKVRYKVIADYPGSPFTVGGILIQSNGHKNNFWVGDQLYTYREPDKYPHLFKKLEWWQERDEKDLPKYLKAKSGRIYKVMHYSLKSQDVYLEDLHTISSWIKDFNPSDREEYLQYLQSQK